MTSRGWMFDASEWACHLIDVDHSWHEKALCRELGPRLFFVERGEEFNAILCAKEVCRECPVQARCLEYATVNSIGYGIWGGMTAEERRRYVNRQNIRVTETHQRVINAYKKRVDLGSRQPAHETAVELNVSKATVRRALSVMRDLESQ
jgi:WhiB family redox-sensing transcriptional regulator